MLKNTSDKFIFLTSSLVIILFLSISVKAQEGNKTEVADSLIRVVMLDGNEFVGQIVDIDDEKVVLKSESLGQITLHRKYIRSINRVDSPEGEGAIAGYIAIHTTRYLFAASAYGLEKGESYYQNILVFYNQYNIGITDRFSLSVGVIPFFLIAGAATPVGVTPKYSIPLVKNKVNLSVGVLIGGVIGERNSLIALPHITASFGSREKNVSIGAGYVYADGQIQSFPQINFSGVIRISRGLFLMTENYVISDGTDFAGISIIGAKSLLSKSALSYGLGIPFYSYYDEVIAIPWIGLTIPFSKN